MAVASSRVEAVTRILWEEYACLRLNHDFCMPLSPPSTPQVPGAEELVVRVVSSVEKRLDTKPRFAKVFADSDYPKDFPYKSKVSE